MIQEPQITAVFTRALPPLLAYQEPSRKKETDVGLLGAERKALVMAGILLWALAGERKETSRQDRNESTSEKRKRIMVDSLAES